MSFSLSSCSGGACRAKWRGEIGVGGLVVTGACWGGERWKDFLRIPFGRFVEGMGGE